MQVRRHLSLRKVGRLIGDQRPRISQREFAALIRLLPSLTSGSLMVSLNSLTILRVDTESRSLSIEATAINEWGLKIGEILVGGVDEKSIRKLLDACTSIAKDLSNVGWTLTLCDGGRGLLTMGRRVSRLTGHVRANPLTLSKLLRML